jgi:SAM-dependent methyltransferase
VDVRDLLRAWWDEDAAAYDASPGHSLSDPVEAAAWRAVLASLLPLAPLRVLDVGAGTGAMSLLAAELGHDVTALDLSGAMLAKAKEKAAGRSLDVTFVVGQAEEPPPGPFDVVMARHVVWTLPEPADTLAVWRGAVRPGGRLVIFEGSWGSAGPWDAGRDAVASALERALGIGGDHHGPYPPDVLHRLPLRRVTSPAPFVEAVRAAGWSRIRLVRLRDVEWVAERRAPWPIGLLRHRPRYAIVAES